MGYSSCLHKPCILSLACLAFSPIDCDHCEIIEEFYGESIGAEERDSLHRARSIVASTCPFNTASIVTRWFLKNRYVPFASASEPLLVCGTSACACAAKLRAT